MVPTAADNASYSYNANVQLDEETEREPLLTWAATAPADSHPINYFVPNFGVDHDISTSILNTKSTEKILNHTLVIPEKKEPED